MHGLEYNMMLQTDCGAKAKQRAYRLGQRLYAQAFYGRADLHLPVHLEIITSCSILPLSIAFDIDYIGPGIVVFVQDGVPVDPLCLLRVGVCEGDVWSVVRG